MAGSELADVGGGVQVLYKGLKMVMCTINISSLAAVLETAAALESHPRKRYSAAQGRVLVEIPLATVG
jgi:hypothetical protein